MRIAITGTHSVGKSTLAHDFVTANPIFIHEEEPYRALRNIYNIQLGKDSTRFCNGIQLFYSLSRTKQYPNSSHNVIFDRSPADFIAYSEYTKRYHKTNIDQLFVESLIATVQEGLQFIDLLVFVPLVEEHVITLEDDGIRPLDESYRIEVDEIFKQMYFENLYNVFPKIDPPKLIELTGNRQTRISKLSQILGNT